MPVMPGLLSGKKACQVKSSAAFFVEPTHKNALSTMTTTTLLPAMNPKIDAGQGLRNLD